ncbi:hypothetical protein AB4851_10135 [Burkholderia sp. 22PA0099]|uniref:hypothetical protein n=1 Tax=Burkholderia sp. 22PA0099 TaxID=3237372 RepID=UPI0039C3DFF7
MRQPIPSNPATERAGTEQFNATAVTFVVSLAVFMATLDMFVVNVALNSIGSQMGNVPLDVSA